MNPGAKLRRSWFGGLGFRLASLLAVALLPLGLFNVMQTSALWREAAARSQAALMGETMQAAAQELRLIQQAQGTAAALASAVAPLIGDVAACSALMSNLLRSLPHLSLVAYIPLSGKMECSSYGEVIDFGQDPLFAKFSAQPVPGFVVNPRSRITGGSVLGISHPVFDAQGAFIGIISLSLPHAALSVADPLSRLSGHDRPLVLFTFDQDGAVLTASEGADQKSQLPAGLGLGQLANRGSFSFSGVTAAGESRSFSVVPLAVGKLYVLGSWPVVAQSRFPLLNTGPYFFPVLMWAASLLVALLAAERLVTRHIRALRRSIVAFTRGSRMIEELDTRGAPAEIREVADAYLRMTDTILHDEAELEDTVHQKDVLLREVHHRVKNNLQLIASIMNMQMRQAKSPESKALMLGLQERVMSLATVHRGLYQTTGLADVRADELLNDIVRQIVNMGSAPGRSYIVHTEFDDLRLTPDQAVPLSLLLTEALTNAMKYAGTDSGAPPGLSVSLRRAADTSAVLRIANSIRTRAPVTAPDPLLTGGTGLGSQLLTAFAQQIGGRIERVEQGDSFALSITFVVTSLLAAEAGRAAAAADADGQSHPQHEGF